MPEQSNYEIASQGLEVCKRENAFCTAWKIASRLAIADEVRELNLLLHPLGGLSEGDMERLGDIILGEARRHDAEAVENE